MVSLDRARRARIKRPVEDDIQEEERRDPPFAPKIYVVKEKVMLDKDGNEVVVSKENKRWSPAEDMHSDYRGMHHHRMDAIHALELLASEDTSSLIPTAGDSRETPPSAMNDIVDAEGPPNTNPIGLNKVNYPSHYPNMVFENTLDTASFLKVAALTIILGAGLSLFLKE